MADVELILHVDNTQALQKIRETQLALAQLEKDVTGRGEEKITLLDEEIKKLKSVADANKNTYDKDKLDQFNRTLGTTNETLDETEDKAEKVSQSSGRMGGSLAAARLIVVALSAAVGLLVKVFKSTGEGADKLKVAIAGVKGGFEAFTRAIATGNLKSLGDQMKRAADEARRYQRTLLEITDTSRAVKVREAEVEYQIKQLTKTVQSATATDLERRDAIQQIYKLEKELNTFRITNSQRAYDNEIQNLSVLYGINKDLLEAYVRQEPAIMDQIRVGDQYNELIKKRNELEGIGIQIKSGLAHRGLKDIEEIARLNAEIAKTTEFERNQAQLATTFSIPVRERLNQVTEVYLDLLGAMGIEEDRATAALSAFNKELDAQAQLSEQEKKIVDAMSKSFKEYADTISSLQAPEFFDTGFADQVKKSLEELPSLMPEVTTITQNVLDQITKGEKEWDESLKRMAEGREEVTKITSESLVDIYRGAFDVISNIQQGAYRKDIEELERSTDTKLRLAEGDKEKQTQILEAAAREREKIEREYAKKQKALSIIETIINTAMAIMQAFKALAGIPIIGPALATKAAIAIGLAGAAQVAIIASQPLEKGGSGDETGIIKGKRHREGGERFLDHIEVEHGEAWGVLSRDATQKYGRQFHDIVTAFNENKVPEIIMPSMNNSVFVNNDGSNSRLDSVIAEQKKLNTQLTKNIFMQVVGNKKIITKGNRTRIVG